MEYVVFSSSVSLMVTVSVLGLLVIMGVDFGNGRYQQVFLQVVWLCNELIKFKYDLLAGKVPGRVMGVAPLNKGAMNPSVHPKEE